MGEKALVLLTIAACLVLFITKIFEAETAKTQPIQTQLEDVYA
jgi:hypothetical protein